MRELRLPNSSKYLPTYVHAVEYEDGIDGPPRVWLGHMDIPGLAMSRSLGDTVAHSAGVSSEPELSVIQLEPEDRVVVIASDGLWEFMSNQEVRFYRVVVFASDGLRKLMSNVNQEVRL